MKVGDDEPFKASKALTIVPAKAVTEYEIGYGKPPEQTRFKPGRSGNPAGRPKGAKNKSVNRTQERFKDIILEEAYRDVKINDGNRQVSIPMAQAVVRSLAVNAAKGNTRAQRFFRKCLPAQRQPTDATMSSSSKLPSTTSSNGSASLNVDGNSVSICRHRSPIPIMSSSTSKKVQSGLQDP